MQENNMNTHVRRIIYIVLTSLSLFFIIASLLQYSHNQKQKETRDNTRLTDLATIQKALEAYYQDEGEYPLSVGFGKYSICSPQGCPTKTYLEKAPQDPAGYTYQYTTATSRQTYSLYTCLESMPKNGTYTLSCNCEGNNACMYKISSRSK
jgi:type II secretory pathway pseudopilin PulG